MTEKKLLYRIKAHQDPEAFGQLYDLYIDKIYRFVFFKLPSKEQAEDITSDIFLKAWQYLTQRQQSKIRSFSGLIYTIARSTVVDFYRKEGRKQEFVPEGELRISVEDKQILLINEHHDIARILAALQKMKQNYQEIIILKYIEELTHAEIAEVMDMSRAHVRVVLHRALKVLKNLLEA